MAFRISRAASPDRRRGPARQRAARQQLRAGGRDHRGVVGAVFGRRDVEREAVLGGRHRQRRAQAAVRGDAAAHDQRGQPLALARAPRLAHQHVDDGGLKARAEIVQLLVARQLAAGEQRRHRGLEPREAEVEIVAPGQRARQRHRPRVAGRRQLVDRDAARIAEAEQLADLVERLARGVVARRAQQPRRARRVDADQRRVPARHQQREVGIRRRRMRRRDAPGTRPPDGPPRWLTPTSGLPSANASAFAVSTPTSSAPTRPGPAVTAIASRSRNCTPASAIARSDDRHDGRDVLARGDLGHDAAVVRVHRDLRRDDVGAHATAVLDDRGGRLVARRLDAQN